MAHTSEDDLGEAKRLRRRARAISDSGLRRRMQKAADKLTLRGIKKLEKRLKPSRPGSRSSGTLFGA